MTFRKMARGDWTEHGFAWDDVADDDGTGDDNPMISFVDDLEGGAWYDVDVVTAAWDALENREPSYITHLVVDRKSVM